MKRFTVVLSLLLCLCTLFGCGSYSSDKAQKTESDSMQNENREFLSSLPIQTPPDSYVYSFESYHDLSEALLLHDYFIASDLENYGELFTKTISSFHNRTLDLFVPFFCGEVCPLRNKEGFSNISLMTAELYNLPWIWYHCNVNDTDIEIKLAYPSVIKSGQLNSAKTYREVLSFIAPNAPNPDNYTEFESYQEIYEKELVLANNRIVNAMISEVKNSNKIYVMFVYEDLLVSVYADNQLLSDSFWRDFSFAKSASC